jgi:hypothetical protein
MLFRRLPQPSAFPVTRSQTRDPRYDSVKGRLEKRSNEDSTQIPPSPTPADLQKRFANLTKTRREYATKTDTLQPLNKYYDTETAYIEEVYGDEGQEYTNEDKLVDATPAYSTVHLSYESYRDDEDLDGVLLRYSSAVKVVTTAMTTGRFSVLQGKMLLLWSTLAQNLI